MRAELVNCREPHRFQLVPDGCSAAALVVFMGGAAGLDVPLARAVRADDGRCFADFQREVAETARGALKSEGSDGWRRCVDGETNMLVGCDVPHTGEYLATGQAGKASGPECEDAAARYMDQTVENLSAQVRIRVIDEVDADADSARCVVEVRGSQPLNGSLRRLGQRDLPISR